MPRFVATALCLLLTLTAAAAHGGDDHDHAEESAVVVGASAAPQLEIADANLELVAEIADRKLRIYLDRPATNAPIDGVTIQVTADGIPAGTATAKADGTYELPAPWADEPGTKKLRFAVTSGDLKSDLAGDLVVAHAAEVPPKPKAGSQALLSGVPA